MRKYIHIIGLALLVGMAVLAASCQDESQVIGPSICNPEHKDWPKCKPVNVPTPLPE